MKVLVVGGGFGGLKAAIELASRKTIEVTLVSDRDYMLHHSTLYSTATGRDERESAVPIAEILQHHPRVEFIKDEIIKIDARTKQVIGSRNAYEYDILVLSLGLTEHISGINNQEKYSFGVLSLQSAKSIHETFHDLLTSDEKRTIHCAIIGGGMVGVELAGALSDYAKRIKNAHGLTKSDMKLSLIELSDKILPYASRSASRKISQTLKRKGVDLITNQLAEKSNKSSLILRGKKMDTDMTIWTCGGKNNSLFKNHPDIFKLSKRGRVIVNQYMMAYPGIYVLGDNAETKLSGSVKSAIDDAIFVTKNIKRLIDGKSQRARSRQRKPVLSIPISRFWAYVEYGGVYVSGVGGSILRRLVELDSYSHFFPLSKAYALWRKYRTSNEFCTLCKKRD